MRHFLIMSMFFAVGLAGSAEALADDVIFEDGAFVVEGEVLKPEITVVISRENLNKAYDLDQLNESFLHKIVQSVQRAPF